MYSYSFSKYNVIVEYKDKVVIFNLISTEFLIVTKSIFNQLRDGDISAIANKKRLFESHFIHYYGEDETVNIWKSRLNTIKSINEQLSVVILSTTFCNANCEYCYQHSADSKIKYGNMDIPTADLLIEYIFEKANNEEVFIWWFGGEPLLNINIMRYISERLREKGIEFSAYLISNGFFIAENIESIIEVCNVKTVQITLDSIGYKYNSVKKIKSPDAFEKVVSNIELLLENKVYVKIRINFHVDAINSAIETIEFLYRRFHNNQYLKVTCAHIIGENEESIFNVYPNPYIKIYKKLFECGYIKNLKDVQIKDKYVECMVYSDKNVVIDPFGFMYKCEHLIPHGIDRAYSKLGQNYIKDKEYQYWMNLSYTSEECISCQMLPICSGGCKYKAKYIGDKSQCLPVKNCISELITMYMDYLCSKGLMINDDVQFIG